MELETLFSEQKWNILKSLSEEKLSPLQLAKKLNTSIANVSQQLRLLEMANLVKTERVSSRDKGKPRKLFSLNKDYAYIISTMEEFAEKRLLELTSYHKAIIKIWFLEKPELHYYVEKFYWKIEEHLDKIRVIAVKQTNSGAEIILITDNQKEIEKCIAQFTKLKIENIDIKLFSEEEADALIKQKKTPFSSIDYLLIIYDKSRYQYTDNQKLQ